MIQKTPYILPEIDIEKIVDQDDKLIILNEAFGKQ